jgi:bidirectional [NiFe] hydrogenase diaphorase subunit
VACLGTACYIKGAPRVVAALEAAAGVRAGGTTPDGRVSVQTARCLGACGLAPAVIFDGHVAGRQTPEAAAARVREWLGHGPT